MKAVASDFDRAKRLLGTALLAMVLSCRRETPPPAAYVPLSKVASKFGELISVGNHPTPDQYGTGERIGLFRASDGTIWGIPMTLGAGGEILVCAAPGLDTAPVTDRLPPGTLAILGTTNQPTGWRGGTGRLEIVLRDPNGAPRWQAVRSGETPELSACWTPASPGPRQKLHYFRLEPTYRLEPTHRLEPTR